MPLSSLVAPASAVAASSGSGGINTTTPSTNSLSVSTLAPTQNTAAKSTTQPVAPAPTTKSTVAAPTVNANAHDPITYIPPTSLANPLTPPTNTGAPAPVVATAPAAADQFVTSLSSTLDNQKASLDAAYKDQVASYSAQLNDFNDQNKELQQLEDNGMLQQGSTVRQEAAAKQQALDEYNTEFKSNYDARQKLTDTLQTLLQQGQDTINTLKGTSGLSSIMNARISETMANVTGQAGVISTALAAYDTQIGLATTHLTTAVNTINSIYSDQIAYWKNVVDFYSSREKDNSNQMTSREKDQKTYIDAQIKTLQDNVANTQATAKIIQDAMLDPTKALTYAKAGVSLTDSPAQISEKLALQAKADQNVWSAPKLLGGDYVQTNRLTGETRTAVSNVSNSPSSPTSPTAPPPKFTSTQLNKGAANAAMDAAAFKTLDPAVQNFYVNSSTLVTQFDQALQAVKAGTIAPDKVSTNIDAMNIPDTVKAHLKRQLPVAGPSSKSGGLSGVWSGVKNFLGI